MVEKQKKDIVLVVDDDSSNLVMAQEILGVEYSLAAAKSGAKALQYLEHHMPKLILVDINMPEMDGFELVRRIKSEETLRTIPVIFLTADKNPETEKKCFDAGAVDYVTKPFMPDVLLSRIARTLELERYRKNLEEIVEEQTRLLEERTERINQMQESVIQGMANLIENRDGSTGKHVKNTQTYVRMIVEQLREDGLFPDELDEDTANNIIKAAPLHDIGKIRISDTILLKPGRLTDEEFDTMKMHTVYGEEVVKDIITDVEDEDYTDIAVQIAVSHHERWDGRGYPRGLAGEEIPLCARIMAVADVFDALYEERCYKEPIRPVGRVMKILEENKNTQFDGVIVDTFMKLLPQLKQYLEGE